MFTILEIYNEDTADLRSINHHGSERKVVDKNIAELKNKKNGFMQKQTNLGNIARFVGKYDYYLYITSHLKIQIVNI